MKELNDIPTAELAELLEVTTPYISQCKHGRKKWAAKYARTIHKEYGIPLWELRPDVYPREIFDCDEKTAGAAHI